MSIHVLVVVLVAAFLHATWNYFVKRSGDKHRSMSSVVLGHTPAAVAVIVLTPLPHADSYPYIVAGAILHTGYQMFLLNSYRFGNLSLVYPIARGLAPLLVASFSIFVLEEDFGRSELLAIVAIALGLISLAYGGTKGVKESWHGSILAIATGSFIASYTLVDGLGARQAGNALGFYGWLSAINALIFSIIMKWSKPGLIRTTVFTDWRTTLFLGSISFLAYSLAIWAFTMAPIALVAALRETSIVFALFLGIFFLKEKVTWGKTFAISLIVCGVMLLRFAVFHRL